jgi:hypothetical protein
MFILLNELASSTRFFDSECCFSSSVVTTTSAFFVLSTRQLAHDRPAIPQTA